MSLADKRKEPEPVYGWNPSGIPEMQFRCDSCGHWCFMGSASGLFAGRTPICTSCAEMFISAIGDQKDNKDQEAR